MLVVYAEMVFTLLLLVRRVGVCVGGFYLRELAIFALAFALCVYVQLDSALGFFLRRVGVCFGFLRRAGDSCVEALGRSTFCDGFPGRVDFFVSY